MIRKQIGDFAIVDFEASSLSSESWPIEVGLSWLENGAVHTWSTLIRPASDWEADDWSKQSAAVHGIPFVDLRDAPEAPMVAATFLDVLAGRTLVSDAPEFDERWLLRLLENQHSRPELEIEDYDAISFALFTGLALDMMYENLERRPAPHRAGPDSARLAAAWLKATEY